MIININTCSIHDLLPASFKSRGFNFFTKSSLSNKLTLPMSGMLFITWLSFTKAIIIWSAGGGGIKINPNFGRFLKIFPFSLSVDLSQSKRTPYNSNQVSDQWSLTICMLIWRIPTDMLQPDQSTVTSRRYFASISSKVWSICWRRPSWIIYNKAFL